MLKKAALVIITFVLVFWSCNLWAEPAYSLPLIAQTPPPNLITDYSQVSAANRLVDIQSVNRNIRLDIRYATPNNFVNRTLYPVSRCLLRRPFAQRLSDVQKDLETMGLGLMVYDCYRPWSVTWQMWQILPDSRYVGNPARGSRHN
ncbi:peptidase M15, partial [Arthrospira sp. O9.13F]